MKIELSTFYLKTILFSSFLVFFLPNHQTTQSAILNQEIPSFCSADTAAKRIAVKVRSDDWGTGVIVKQVGKKFTVLTNRHVVDQKNKNYTVQIFGGKTYPIKSIDLFSKPNDMALLHFEASDCDLCKVAEISRLPDSIPIGTRVFSAGFPIVPKNPVSSSGLEVLSGKLEMKLTVPFDEGYQFGYSVSVLNGMSGGPLLTCDGKLIGINGYGTRNHFRLPYTLKNGETIKSDDKRYAALGRLSWAIPIPQFLIDFQAKNAPDALPKQQTDKFNHPEKLIDVIENFLSHKAKLNKFD